MNTHLTVAQKLDIMLSTCASSGFTHWNQAENFLKVEFNSLLLMVKWLNEMKLQGEMTTEQARIHIDIQKNTMRTRLMALPNMPVVEIEHMMNAGIDSIRKELYSEMNWLII
jgi:hypothetical protein